MTTGEQQTLTADEAEAMLTAAIAGKNAGAVIRDN